MKQLAILLSFLLVFIPTVAFAGEPEVSQGRITKIPWAGTLLSEVDPNVTHKVPFPGILLDKTAWATVQAQKNTHKKELELKDLQMLKLELKKDSEISDLKIELKWTVKTYEERIKVKDQYTKRLEDMVKEDQGKIDWVPWAFLGGVVVGGLIAIGVAFGINESK